MIINNKMLTSYSARFNQVNYLMTKWVITISVLNVLKQIFNKKNYLSKKKSNGNYLSTRIKLFR